MPHASSHRTKVEVLQESTSSTSAAHRHSVYWSIPNSYHFFSLKVLFLCLPRTPPLVLLMWPPHPHQGNVSYCNSNSTAMFWHFFFAVLICTTSWVNRRQNSNKNCQCSIFVCKTSNSIMNNTACFFSSHINKKVKMTSLLLEFRKVDWYGSILAQTFSLKF